MEGDAVVHRDVAQARPPAGDAQLHDSTRLRKKQKDAASRFNELFDSACEHQRHRINLAVFVISTDQ